MNSRRDSSFNLRRAFILGGLLSLVVFHAQAMSWTERVASPGAPVSGETNWPAGVRELVNDPLRTDGWRPCFSEWPNDVCHYEFKAARTAEVNLLIRKLAAIKHAKLQVRLDPGKEARGLGFTTTLKEGNGTSVTFSIGDQPTINAWYQRLKETEPGIRQFGVIRYTETPTALPPTLTLYVGNASIDLNSLEIPASILVSAEAAEQVRKEPAGDAVLRAIDALVARHAVKTNQSVKQPNQEYVR